MNFSVFFERYGVLVRVLKQVLVSGSDFIKVRNIDWAFVGEGADWVINSEGRRILGELHKFGIRVAFFSYPFFVRGRVVHFGSLHSFRPRRSRKFYENGCIILNCYHGDFGISEGMDSKLREVLADMDNISCIVVSNSTMRDRFVAWGVHPEKLCIIPVGVDTNYFSPVDEVRRLAVRQQLKLPEDRFIIGSFQKDGNGWADGNEPKLIKGPDVFCDVVEEIAKKYKIHVLLTGPARGYVKNRLAKAGIGFTHRYLKSMDDLPSYYHAIDCYLMCSREEGGPKSIPECLATGTPFVATRTGMVSDVEAGFKLGWYCDVDDKFELVANTIDALTNKQKRIGFAMAAPQYASNFSWKHIGQAYFELYRHLV